MQNQSFHSHGGRPAVGLRGPRGGSGACALLVALGLLVCSLPGWAAEVVEVRVGRHPTFTRVVFELDRLAGYRIERTDSDVAELVVSLDASSIPRSIQTSKRLLIEEVEVEPAGAGSVARVRLAKSGLRLKEMILSGPPRIVLDVLKEAEQEMSPLPIAVGGAIEEAAFEAVVAQIPVEPEPVEVVVEEFEAPIDEVVEVAEALAPSISVSVEEPPQAEPEISNGVESVALPEPIVEVAEAAPPVAKAEPSAREEASPPRPMVAREEPASEGVDWMNWALVGVGAFLLLIGVGAVATRRRSDVEVGDEGWDGDAFEAGIAYTGEGAAEFVEEEAVAVENPFEVASEVEEETVVLAIPDEPTVVPEAMPDEDTTVMSALDEEKESELVTFGAEENEMDDMEVISRDQVNESLGGGTLPPAVGGASEEFQQMVVEMGRRMEALESRCDELVDARDRLERQVAAQTEELRVQRAAIARTQRAVRNLGRGEESEEQEATEPAIRDPRPPSDR